MAKKLKLKWTKSDIGMIQKQRETIRALGLRRLNQEIVKEDTPVVRGMANAVHHLVDVEEIES